MNWKNIGMMIGGIIVAVVPAWSHFDLSSRIDSGKDEQRAHWIAERKHKDSVDAAFRDTVMFYLHKQDRQ